MRDWKVCGSSGESRLLWRVETRSLLPGSLGHLAGRDITYTAEGVEQNGGELSGNGRNGNSSRQAFPLMHCAEAARGEKRACSEYMRCPYLVCSPLQTTILEDGSNPRSGGCAQANGTTMQERKPCRETGSDPLSTGRSSHP